MKFDYNIHKNQWIFGIDFTLTKYCKAFYFNFAIWSVGIFKITRRNDDKDTN